MVNDVQYIEAVLSAISMVAKRFNLQDSEIGKLCIATEEAIVNVITHAFAVDEVAYLDISLEVSGINFSVIIADKGKPYDFTSLALSGEHLEGLGVRMMEGLTNKLEFKNLGANGREQHLIKHLVSLPEYKKREQEAATHTFEKIEFDFHPLREEETIEVAQCIYDEFGYTYLSEMIYYPQQFFEACQRGEIYSLVATAPDGEVAGHLALTITNDIPGLAEMGIGVVKRKFRKYSIMNNLTTRIIDIARNELNLNAMFAQPVLYHSITQKMCNNYGLAACSMVLHYTSDDFTPTFAASKRRDSVGCGMLPFQSLERTIHLHDEILPMITNVLNNMKVVRNLAPGVQPGEGSRTIAALSINKKMRIGKYMVENMGADFDDHFKHSLITAKVERCAIIEMYINLSDPSAPYCYESAKSEKFFCTGIIPQGVAGDYLTLACLLNEVVDYDEMQTIEPFTTLLAQIRKLDPNEL